MEGLGALVFAAFLIPTAPRRKGSTLGAFGLILPNRGVLLGAVTPDELLDLGEAADKSGAFQSLWVGDSLLAKPRLESVIVLGALAGRTRRVRLGVACMATFAHRHPVLLAVQWSTLDVLSNGRALLDRLPRRLR